MLRLRNLETSRINLVHGAANPHSPASQATLLLGEAREVGITPQLTLLPGNGEFGVTDAKAP